MGKVTGRQCNKQKFMFTQIHDTTVSGSTNWNQTEITDSFNLEKKKLFNEFALSIYTNSQI